MLAAQALVEHVALGVLALAVVAGSLAEVGVCLLEVLPGAALAVFVHHAEGEVGFPAVAGLRGLFEEEGGLGRVGLAAVAVQVGQPEVVEPP